VITIYQRHRQTDRWTDDKRSQDRAFHKSALRGKKNASNCAVISSSWVSGSLAVTHDPRPTDPFPSLLGLDIQFGYRVLTLTHTKLFGNLQSYACRPIIIALSGVKLSWSALAEMTALRRPLAGRTSGGAIGLGRNGKWMDPVIPVNWEFGR